MSREQWAFCAINNLMGGEGGGKEIALSIVFLCVSKNVFRRIGCGHFKHLGLLNKFKVIVIQFKFQIHAQQDDMRNTRLIL